MKAFLKKHWLPLSLIGLVAVALVIWHLWPKTPGVKRKITFFDLPIITGDAGPTSQADEPSNDSIADKDHSTMAPDSPSDLDSLINRALKDYDNG